MSKSSKRNPTNKCEYVLKRNTKNGDIGDKCGVKCVEKFCYAHSDKRKKFEKTYNSKKYEDNKRKHIDEKIEAIKDGNGKIPNMEKKKLTLYGNKNEVIYLTKRMLACRIRIDPKVANELPPDLRTKKAYEEARVEWEEEFNPKKDGKLESYIYKKEQIFYCFYPRQIYIEPFTGTEVEANKKIIQYKKEIELLKKKIADAEYFIEKIKSIQTDIDSLQITRDNKISKIALRNKKYNPIEV